MRLPGPFRGLHVMSSMRLDGDGKTKMKLNDNYNYRYIHVCSQPEGRGKENSNASSARHKMGEQRRAKQADRSRRKIELKVNVIEVRC